MSSHLLVEGTADLGAFDRARMARKSLPFAPITIAHIYVKLEFKPQFENAQTASDARGFLRSVTRAGIAANRVAAAFSGHLMELQGSLLHVGLPVAQQGSHSAESLIKSFAGHLHAILARLFSDPTSRVDGWRMTADSGKTLVVAGRGVHGDDSWVSLGKSANKPAKHLYSELELPEDKRDLKRFFIGVRDAGSGKWTHQHLDLLPSQLLDSKAVIEEAQRKDLALNFDTASFQGRIVQADAAPFAPAGHPASPNADSPQTQYGWVMRADLDGFTERVENCFDDNSKLTQLAQSFYAIMDAAAAFILTHRESLAQLPWAGDNFTAAAVFQTKSEYDQALPTRLVELTLDFEKEMNEAAVLSGFGGWAHGVAGGEALAASRGNIYIAGAEIGGRRFLIGAGEGFGRSAQAFGDINPKAGHFVAFGTDWNRLDDRYRRAFEPAVTRRGAQSSLFRIAATAALLRSRSAAASVASATSITFGSSAARSVSARPFSQ